MKKVALILFSLFFLSVLQAQNWEFDGEVVMFNTYPVNNFEIKSKKAKATTQTDAEGSFALECKEKDVVLLMDRAFHTLSQKVEWGDEPLRINLVFKDTPKNRDHVVSKGYISREDLEYALDSLLDENNDYCNYNDLYSLIKHEYPQVEVKNNLSGELGVFLRRGTKSLTQETQMLYVVDGMRLDILTDINPCEIAELRILTEVQAAKYGAGASNGALEIRTKRAR
jgi:hypothetical protein